MGKLLRVMVIMLFLLSAGALTLGTMLFIKRELLKGRTQKLENTIIALGATIESEAAEEKSAASLPARDIAPCTPEELDNPDRSAFWQNYKMHLEDGDHPVLDLKKRKYELMSYYKRDALGKVELDPVTGLKITEGEGTMQLVLDDMLKKSEAQLTLLGDTRAELRTVREELVDTITELNEKKATLRSKLKYIVELEAEIASLKDKIRELENNIRMLEDEKAALEARIEELQAQMVVLNDQLNERDQKIQELEDENKKLHDIISGSAAPGAGGVISGPMGSSDIVAGIKGTVVAADNEWRFCVIELSDRFINEVMGDEEAVQLPRIELHLRRPGSSKQYVTKVQLRQLRRADKLGVGDILGDWQQLPVKPGDVCFY